MKTSALSAWKHHAARVIDLRVISAAAVAVLVTALGAGHALADDPTPTPSAAPSPTNPDLTGSLFLWAAKSGGLASNWPEGAMYAAIGLIGALLTVYLFAGELLPSMGGRPRLSLMQQDVDDFRRRRSEALGALSRCAKSPGSCPEATVASWTLLCTHSTGEIARVEGAIGMERRRLAATAVPLYLVLGGFFAAALATTVLQALFVGFGWTAIADRAGLKRDQEESKKQADTEVDKIVADVASRDQELAELREAGARTLREKEELAARLAAMTIET